MVVEVRAGVVQGGEDVFVDDDGAVRPPRLSRPNLRICEGNCSVSALSAADRGRIGTYLTRLDTRKAPHL